MINPISTKNTFILPLIVWLFSGFQPAQKQNTGIVLRDETMSITPKEFYIANVIDKRENRTAVAWILPAAIKENDQPKLLPVDLQGGGLFALKQFIAHNLPRNTALRPVVITLKKMTITETSQASGRVEGHVNLAMSFDLENGGEEMATLVDYNGSAVYNRKAGPAQEIEPTLRHVLENGLVYLNEWINRQADTNIKLAKGVKVTFTDYEEKTEGDSIYYSAKRPLTWDDFQSKTDISGYDAEVFPGIGYGEHTEIVKGIVNLHLTIKVFLPKSACWVKEGSRNSYSLNHEQRHFDIVKIVAEHFKKKISAEKLPVANYDGPINMEYLESLREMNVMQKLYDNETRHGTDQSAQTRWNEKIDKELVIHH